MDVIKIISKRFNILIGIVIFCFAACICTILFYKPHVKGNEEILNEALEKQRQSAIAQREAVQKMVEQAEKNIEYLRSRDSSLNNELKKTSSAIKNVRDYEKINAINNYNSVELQRAYAELARQYKNSK